MQTQSLNQVSGTALGGEMDAISALTTGYSYEQTGPTVIAAGTVSGTVANPSAGGNKTVHWLIGLIVLLILLKMLTEHKKSGLEMHHVRISVLNWFVITALAVTGIVSAKAIANKYGPNGSLTKIINAA